MVYENVCAYCEKKNLPIYEFEKLCGLGNGTVAGWKDDKTKPTLKTLEKISSATGLSINKLIK